VERALNDALHELRGLWVRHFEGQLAPAESARLHALMQDAALMEAFSLEQAGLAGAEPAESLNERDWSSLNARLLSGFRRRRLALAWRPLALALAGGLALASGFWFHEEAAAPRPALGVPAGAFGIAREEALAEPRREPAVAASMRELKVARFSVVLDQDKAGPASVKVFKSSGALVKQVFAGELSRGKHRFEWNGQDAGGRSAGPGQYEIEIKASSGTERREFEIRPKR
jgi:hypothetical protein